MNGRIVRPQDNGTILELPEVGRLHIGMKNEKGYPYSIDWFRPTGKYAGIFTQALGEKPNTLQIIFPDDNPEAVCREELEYRDAQGALVASGDGREFKVWNGKRYEIYLLSKYPDLMERVAARYPKKPRREDDNGWDARLTMRFIIPAVRGVVGVWQFSTKGAASSIKNIRNSFDGVQLMRGTVCQSVFDLSVQFAKSNKPGQNSRYPVVSLVANDCRIDEVRKMLLPADSTKNLLIEK